MSGITREQAARIIAAGDEVQGQCDQRFDPFADLGENGIDLAMSISEETRRAVADGQQRVIDRALELHEDVTAAASVLQSVARALEARRAAVPFGSPPEERARVEHEVESTWHAAKTGTLSSLHKLLQCVFVDYERAKIDEQRRLELEEARRRYRRYNGSNTPAVGACHVAAQQRIYAKYASQQSAIERGESRIRRAMDPLWKGAAKPLDVVSGVQRALAEAEAYAEAEALAIATAEEEAAAVAPAEQDSQSGRA